MSKNCINYVAAKLQTMTETVFKVQYIKFNEQINLTGLHVNLHTNSDYEIWRLLSGK
jgi:hypothetical protein